MKVYYDQDASFEYLLSKKITVLGFGSQGHAHSLNLHESGFNVCVGLRRQSSSWQKAENAGLEVKEISEACIWADVIMILLPDQNQKKVYEESIQQCLTPGKTLAFGHGFNIHYKWIVHQDYTGDAKELALAWSKGIGGTRAGVIETTFKDETETDLFGEQAVLCGGSAQLIKAGFEVLTEAGYPAELAYFECMHELKLIVDLYYEGGLSRMNYSVSDTAEYGGMTRGSRVITGQAKNEMKKILKELQDGSFANEWYQENFSGAKKMEQLRKENREHPIEQVGSKLRSMMSWLLKNNEKEEIGV
jgi:ketol-acid reductoisomerase